MSKIDNIEFTKVTMNIPKKLLNRFDKMAYLNQYSRVEAIKESLRIFIAENTPEGYTEPEDMKTTWRGMMDAILEISEDPKYQKLNAQQKQMVTSTTPMAPQQPTVPIEEQFDELQKQENEKLKEKLRKNKKNPARK